VNAQEAIESAIKLFEIGEAIEAKTITVQPETARVILAVLRAQQEQEDPQPLTPEQLMKRKGKPVWYQPKGQGWWTVFSKINDDPRVLYFSTIRLRKIDYGGKALCYDHEPKEV
jgi:hypothetical protein